MVSGLRTGSHLGVGNWNQRCGRAVPPLIYSTGGKKWDSAGPVGAFRARKSVSIDISALVRYLGVLWVRGLDTRFVSAFDGA